ncbi:hypothetical protein EV426DRAFT_712716 [Tirmania nivea]|nr:hypothetical protein EV426DRAFT_712716 [Tirmania nivea]
MGEILLLLAYAMAIAKSTSSRSTIVWGSSQNADTLYYKGEPVYKAGLCSLAHSILSQANNILTHELLLDPTFDIFTQDIVLLKDDMTSRMTGHSFLTDSRNTIGIRPAQQMILRRVMQDRLLGSRLYTLVHGNNICWLLGAIDGYLFHVQEFLNLMAVLVNVTGGQLARGTELLTLRYANSGTTLRNIYIQDSQVIIVADYYKNRGQLQKSCPKVRFLPPTVAQLLIVYLICIVPFVQFLYHKKSTTPPECLKNFLFVSLTQEKPLETNTMTKTMQREALTTLGWAVGTSAWRQIAVSWNRRIRYEGNNLVNDTLIDCDDEEDEDLNDIQAGHTGEVSKLHYGVRADILHDLTPELIATYREISVQWHVFLGFSDTACITPPRAISEHSETKATNNKGIDRKPKADKVTPVCQVEGTLDCQVNQGNQSGASIPGSPATNSIITESQFPSNSPSRLSPSVLKQGIIHGEDPPPEKKHFKFSGQWDNIRDQPEQAAIMVLKRIFGPQVNFRSQEQKDCLVRVVKADPAPLLIVLPTGAGKSILFLTPASLPQALVTVVIVPYVALKADLVAKAQASRQYYTLFTPKLQEPVPLVFASAEHLKENGGLLHYLRLMTE